MISQKLYELKNWKGVLHTTWNPNGPGVIRIHLIPPKFVPFKTVDTLVIINGQDILPINESWAILLSEYIKNVNAFGNKPMSDEELDKILSDTFKGVKKVFPRVKDEILSEDLDAMIGIFEDVARGRIVECSKKPMTLGEYAPYMTAPHRMDLMVSAMTKDGHWHCNQKCLHCYAADQELADEKELSTDEWKEIIKKLQNAKIPQLTFTGGEPTMRDDIPELVDAAQWFVTRLNTNGVKLTPEYCKRLYDASLDSVQVTFYSSDADIHNKLVGAPNFDKTVEGIKNALAAGLNLSINTPLCTLNKDYRKTLEFLHEMGVMYVTCSGLILTGNATEDASVKTQLTNEELYDVLKEAVDYVYANDMEISFTSPGWLEEDKLKEMGLTVPSCGACLSNMAITPSGHVVPCQSWLSEEPLGDIRTEKWEKIWDSAECKKIRDISARMDQKCQLRGRGEDKNCY
ncbi:radical SAM additional 4Fe4S-binding SPASM domain-containing protein [Ruminococcaceae bacterium KH2T8]|nr:radical SAM additional 4Fe4S-binding SPASM domain-containing protein [Ruminococcaceae bacterium KH2T8]